MTSGAGIDVVKLLSRGQREGRDHFPSARRYTAASRATPIGCGWANQRLPVVSGHRCHNGAHIWHQRCAKRHGDCADCNLYNPNRHLGAGPTSRGGQSGGGSRSPYWFEPSPLRASDHGLRGNITDASRRRWSSSFVSHTVLTSRQPNAQRRPETGSRDNDTRQS